VIPNEVVCVRVPDVPVSVTVDDPAAVPAGAVSVSVAAVPGVSVREDGCAVTPAGRPAIATCTLEENPFWGAASTETVPAVPSDVKVNVAGVTPSEKSAGGGGAAWTESEACVLTLWPLELAVNVAIAVAATAEDAAVNINGEAAPGVTESVAGESVTPLGRPDTAIVVAPVPAGAVNSREAVFPVPPAVRLMMEGVRVSEG
jgi:hypothetical protein